MNWRSEIIHTILLYLDEYIYFIMLASFIEFLTNNDLVSFDVLSDTSTGFENRLKIQKMVYISQLFGLNLKYEYDLYKYGPYSPRLAMDYYELAEVPEKYNDERNVPLSRDFDRDGFLNIVTQKDTDWLEVATTIIEERIKFPGKDQLVNRVHTVKPKYTLEVIGNIYDELITSDLNRLLQIEL